MKYLLRLIAITMLLFGLAQSAWAEDKVAKDAVAEKAVEGAVHVKVKTAESMPKADVKHGKKIFDSICTHCHYITHKVSAVGCPGLKNVVKRHDEAWLARWIQNPEGFAKKNNEAKTVVAANPYGLIMPTIPEMQIEQNRKDVIEYLKTLK